MTIMHPINVINMSGEECRITNDVDDHKNMFFHKYNIMSILHKRSTNMFLSA